LGGPQRKSGQRLEEKFFCLCWGLNLDCPVIQPVARHYTDWATWFITCNNTKLKLCIMIWLISKENENITRTYKLKTTEHKHYIHVEAFSISILYCKHVKTEIVITAFIMCKIRMNIVLEV
jgi:hypothetical protein